MKMRIRLRLYDFGSVAVKCKKECVLAEGAIMCMKLEAEGTTATYTASYIASTIHLHNAQIPAKCKGHGLKMLHGFAFIAGVEAAPQKHQSFPIAISSTLSILQWTSSM